ncbi:MAG: methyltransferase domain-containing protein [bacterium]|nr:methyltransferase domain-containing protein [bacterium]
MSDPSQQWKNFYRNEYADHWRQFASELSQQDYHVRYQSLCLAPLSGLHGQRVLEVGAGRGDLIERFTPADNFVTGCDLSWGNLLACQSRFAGRETPVELVHADAETLPFRDGTFDAVYSLSVLFYCPSVSRAVDEMFRVTRPGGLVVFDMLNALHVTSLTNHIWRRLRRWMGRDLGLTSLSSPAELHRAISRHADDYHLYGNYLVLPAGLPVLKEAGNLCRYVPSLAYAMREGAGAWLGHKLLAHARKRG